MFEFECSLFLQRKYNTIEEALHEVQQGNAWVAMYIQEDFSKDFCLRAIATRTGTGVTPEVINSSTVHLYMDVTSMCMVRNTLQHVISSDHQCKL